MIQCIQKSEHFLFVCTNFHSLKKCCDYLQVHQWPRLGSSLLLGHPVWPTPAGSCRYINSGAIIGVRNVGIFLCLVGHLYLCDPLSASLIHSLFPTSDVPWVGGLVESSYFPSTLPVSQRSHLLFFLFVFPRQVFSIC